MGAAHQYNVAFLHISKVLWQDGLTFKVIEEAHGRFPIISIDRHFPQPQHAVRQIRPVVVVANTELDM